MKRVLVLLLQLVLTFSAYAANFDENKVTSRASVATKEGITFEYLKDSDNQIWFRPNLPEDQRYFQYGKEKIDLNSPRLVNFSLDAKAVDFVDYKDSVFIIAQVIKDGAPIDSFEIMEASPFFWPLSEDIYRTRVRERIGMTIFYGVIGFLSYSVLDSYFLTGACAIAGTATNFFWQSSFADLDKEHCKPYSRLESVRKLSRNRYDQVKLRPFKADPSKPWSLENLRLKASRGKAHRLDTWLSRNECMSRLMGSR